MYWTIGIVLAVLGALLSWAIIHGGKDRSEPDPERQQP